MYVNVHAQIALRITLTTVTEQFIVSNIESI